MNDFVEYTGYIIRLLDESELWLFIVMAVLLFVLVERFYSSTKRDLSALRMLTAATGVCYFIHLLRVSDPYGANYIRLGLQAFLFAMIVQGLAAIVFCFVALICTIIKTTLYRLFVFPCIWVWKHRPKKAEPEIDDSPIEEEPEPTPEELDALFQQELDAARRKFARRCEIIKGQGLTELEREGAITRARSTMTSEINKIMEKYG